MTEFGLAAPFWVVVLAWLAKVVVMALICALLAWLGIRVLDALTPKIHQRKRIGENPITHGRVTPEPTIIRRMAGNREQLKRCQADHVGFRDIGLCKIGFTVTFSSIWTMVAFTFIGPWIIQFCGAHSIQTYIIAGILCDLIDTISV